MQANNITVKNIFTKITDIYIYIYIMSSWYSIKASIQHVSAGEVIVNYYISVNTSNVITGVYNAGVNILAPSALSSPFNTAVTANNSFNGSTLRFSSAGVNFTDSALQTILKTNSPYYNLCYTSNNAFRSYTSSNSGTQSVTTTLTTNYINISQTTLSVSQSFTSGSPYTITGLISGIGYNISLYAVGTNGLASSVASTTTGNTTAITKSYTATGTYSTTTVGAYRVITFSTIGTNTGNITFNSGISTSQLLVVGGGASGGPGDSPCRAGGGAGGLLYGTNVPVSTGTTYNITIGNGGGGNGIILNNPTLYDGGSSYFGSLIAYGGKSSPNTSGGAQGNSSTGTGILTSGVGYAGGGEGNPGNGGGGGAGMAGAATSNGNVGGNGGNGLAYSITGTSVYYAGGGGGGSWIAAGGTGGSGGGGNGGDDTRTSVNSVTAGSYYGAGGGGAGFGGTPQAHGSGYQGVVIVSFVYP